MPAVSARMPWPRLVGAAVLCSLLTWLSIGPTLNLLLAESRPDIALRIWPMGAEAQTGLAARQLQPDASPATIETARALAAQALARAPALAPAARTLGLAQTMAGDMPAADRTFAYAEAISRRDLATEMWLIERRVAQGDVAGALRHYDIALRTDRSSYDVLIPILVEATSDPRVAQALLPYLARRPLWSEAYIQQLSASARDPASLYVQLRALRLDPASDADHGILANGIQRLVALDRPALARRLIGGADRAGLWDGGFERPGGFVPFAWWLRDDPDLTAYREARPDAQGTFALHVTARNEQGGEVAHQLVLLPPGRYRLVGLAGAAAGADADARILISLSCAGGGAPLAAQVPLPAPARRFAAAFAVPSGCPFQWLRIATPPDRNVDGWLDALAIVPDGRGSAR